MLVHASHAARLIGSREKVKDSAAIPVDRNDRGKIQASPAFGSVLLFTKTSHKRFGSTRLNTSAPLLVRRRSGIT